MIWDLSARPYYVLGAFIIFGIVCIIIGLLQVSKLGDWE